MFGRRRRLLIDRRQFTLLAINLAYMSLVVLVFCVILFAPVAFVFYDSSATFEQQDQAADHLLLLHKTVWPAVFIVFGLFCAHSVVYSHRIIGPLYRFRLVFDKVLDGDLTMRANLRTKDHLHLEAKLINRMLDSLAERLDRVVVHGSAARATLAHVRSIAVRDEEDELERAMDGLSVHLESMHAVIESFRLPGQRVEPLHPLAPHGREDDAWTGEHAAALAAEPAVNRGRGDEPAARGAGSDSPPEHSPHESFELVEPGETTELPRDTAAAAAAAAPARPRAPAAPAVQKAAQHAPVGAETVIVRRGATEDAVDRALDSLMGVCWNDDDENGSP